MENRVFKGPAARREQSLWKERTLVWLETRRRREGEGGAGREGVRLRGLHFYTEGNAKAWTRLSLSLTDWISLVLMDRPPLFGWGQEPGTMTGGGGEGWYHQDTGGFKREAGLCQEKSPRLHNFACGLCIPQTITNKQKLCMGVLSVSHDCTRKGIRNTGCPVYGLSSKCLLRGLTKWCQQTI